MGSTAQFAEATLLRSLPIQDEHGGRASDTKGMAVSSAMMAPAESKGDPGLPGSAGNTGDPNNFSSGGTTATETLKIVITVPPPSSVDTNAAFGLTAAVETSQNQVLTSFEGNLTVILSANPGTAVLAGPVTVRATDGVATFCWSQHQ